MTMTAVREGLVKGADDTETLAIRQDGHTLTVTGAPPGRNRIGPGILEVMRRTELTADTKGTWEDFRTWAGELGLFVDPQDYPPDEPSRDERYEGLFLSGLIGPHG